MERAWRVRTRVLPGNRIEITAPELPEGSEVEVAIMSERKAPTQHSVLDLIDSLPPGPHSYPTWDEFKRRFQEERDAWKR